MMFIGSCTSANCNGPQRGLSMNLQPGASTSWGDVPDRGVLNLGLVMSSIAGLGLLFQVGHFAEHAFQFAVWVLGELSNICGRDTPWMSPWVTELVRGTGI